MPEPQLVSVIMPVLDGEAHVTEQLAALAAQSYRGQWELVVCDNGCRDRTFEIVRSFAPRLPALTIVDASTRRGLNFARNAGLAAARGDFLAFCDADDVATPGWLQALVEAAAEADIVGGRLEWETLNDPVVQAWRGQTEPMTELDSHQGFMRYAPGGNMGVWTRVARELGWEEQFSFGSSDHGFGWRGQLAGYRLAFAPDALMRQRFRATLPALARQQFRYGRSAPRLYRAYRDVGLSPDNRRALRQWRRLARDVPDLWASRAARGRWVGQTSYRVGRLVGSVQERMLCL